MPFSFHFFRDSNVMNDKPNAESQSIDMKINETFANFLQGNEIKKQVAKFCTCVCLLYRSEGEIRRRIKLGGTI